MGAEISLKDFQEAALGAVLVYRRGSVGEYVAALDRVEQAAANLTPDDAIRLSKSNNVFTGPWSFHGGMAAVIRRFAIHQKAKVVRPDILARVARTRSDLVSMLEDAPIVPETGSVLIDPRTDYNYG